MYLYVCVYEISKFNPLCRLDPIPVIKLICLGIILLVYVFLAIAISVAVWYKFGIKLVKKPFNLKIKLAILNSLAILFFCKFSTTDYHKH